MYSNLFLLIKEEIGQGGGREDWSQAIHPQGSRTDPNH